MQLAVAKRFLSRTPRYVSEPQFRGQTQPKFLPAQPPAMAKTATFTTLGETLVLSNIGPLPTAFTPPPSCLTSMYESNQYLELGIPSQSRCFPPGYTTATSSIGYFSPGVCPSGYFAASPQRPGFLDTDESGSYCCPMYVPTLSLVLKPTSGFVYPTRTGSLELLASCSSEFATPTTTALTSYWRVWAPAIVVVWKSADFPTSPPTPPVGGPTPTSPSGDSTPPQHSSHAGGTVIAVAIVVPAVLIALLVMGFVLYRRRRRGAETAEIISEMDTGLQEVFELQDTKRGPTELSAVAQPAELSE